MPGVPAGDAADNVDDTLDILRRVMAMQRGEGKDGQSPAASGGAQDGNGASGAEDEIQAGCTAVVALLHRRTLYVANAGDSRAVLSRGNVAIAMSEDHKPAQSTERERIVAAGGFLSEIGGITRVNGNLNLSRAIGDLRYKMNSEVRNKWFILTRISSTPQGMSFSAEVCSPNLLLACVQLEPSAQIITAQPDVECFELTPEDQFMVLACDGIWDVMSK